MREHETNETSVVTIDGAVSEAATEAAAETAVTDTPSEGVSEEMLAEAEALRGIYPDFDLAAEMLHPVLGGLLRGEGKPTLRQLYEAVHWEDISAERVKSAVASAVAEAVESAVSAAVGAAVKESEERLLENIRARGLRPLENGLRAAEGIRMHPAVGRLTRRERAMLAKRAENGETIKL